MDLTSSVVRGNLPITGVPQQVMRCLSLSAETDGHQWLQRRWSLQSPRLCGSMFGARSPLSRNALVGQAVGKALTEKCPERGASAPACRAGELRSGALFIAETNPVSLGRGT